MKKDIDRLLKTALTPMDQPYEELNNRILLEVKERENMAGRKRRVRRRIPAAAIAAACILMLCSGTALAVYKYLTPAQVAEETEDGALQEAFSGNDAILVNETQESGGFRITLLGSVAGRNVSDYIPVDADTGEMEDNDKIYTIVAIERADGVQMPDTSTDAYGDTPFYVSHYIHGLDPNQYSIMSMGGNYTEFVKDGIMYRLLEMDNIEMFADRGIYVGVNSGSFYDSEAYNYDANTGEMSCNENYTGVNALFKLPVDTSKADPAAAEAYLKELQASWSMPEEPREMDAADLDAEEFMNRLTPENLDEYAEPIESTRQTCTAEKSSNGETLLRYSYELESGAGTSGTIVLEQLFPDGKSGVNIGSYSYNEKGLSSLLFDVFILNEDGTVTFVAYRPK
ncbi:MAG: hypothetical protein K2L82_00040 [Lachnospiraceae bacterium]|nr:hypothetical protein [Lachnospiraceae bacterium]